MYQKKFLSVACILAIITLIVACAPVVAEPAVEEIPVEEPTVEEVPQEEEIPLTVAVVAGGEVGDLGFIDSANEGLQRIKADLGLETIIVSTRGDMSINLDVLISAAEQADLIFVIPGYFFDEQLKQVIPEFPGKTFVYVDGATDIEGMTSIVFKQNEGAFLAGALAALLTTQTEDLPNMDEAKVIGFMGGADMPVIRDYQVGFNQGAKFAVEDVEIINRYAGTHFDPAKGKETALAIYGEGADIIFQAAGPTGLGVFEAARDANKYVIGVDANQKHLAPEWVVASMRKNVGDAIYLFTESYIAGEITVGEVMAYGLAEKGVGIDYGGMDPDLVPQWIKERIAEFAQEIIDGKILVDQYTG